MKIGKVFTCKIPDHLKRDKSGNVDEKAVMEWVKTANWEEAFTTRRDTLRISDDGYILPDIKMSDDMIQQIKDRK